MKFKKIVEMIRRWGGLRTIYLNHGEETYLEKLKVLVLFHNWEKE